MSPTIALSARLLLLMVVMGSALAELAKASGIFIDQSHWLLEQYYQATAVNQSLGSHAEVMDYGFRPSGKPQIVLVGDSITDFGFVDASQPDAGKYNFGPNYHGWAVMLDDTLQHEAKIVNMAIKAGRTTRGFNQSLPLWLDQIKKIAHEVALVNIAFGANDAVLNSPGWFSSVPQYISVIRTAIKGLRSIGINNIMITTPPPVGARHPQTPDRVNCFTKLYANAAVQLRTISKVPVVNIFDALMNVPNWESEVMRSDALHLTARGNKVMFDEVWSTIQQNFPHISASALPSWYANQPQA